MVYDSSNRAVVINGNEEDGNYTYTLYGTLDHSNGALQHNVIRFHRLYTKHILMLQSLMMGWWFDKDGKSVTLDAK